MAAFRRIVGRAAATVAALVLACAASAAAPTHQPRTLRFETFSVEQGLEQESVLSMLQDRDGFFWFGTQAGLSRYDGYRSTAYRADAADPNALGDNWVAALLEDRGGRLWIGTRGGLQHFDPQRRAFVTVKLPRAGAGDTAQPFVRALAESVRGELWIGTGSGLFRLAPRDGRVTAWRHDPARDSTLPSDDINALALAPSGALWVGTGAGLARLSADGARIERFRLDDDAAPDARHNAVTALRIDAQGTLWIGTGAGLEAWTASDGTPVRRRFGADENLPVDEVQALLVDHDGGLWAGTRSTGLLRWDAAAKRFLAYRQHVTDPHSLADDNVMSLHQDRGGTLWVGTRTGGASRVDLGSGGFERHAVFDPDAVTRAASKVYAIAEGDDGVLWLGSVGGGLHRFDRRRGEVRTYRHAADDPASLPDDNVMSVHVDAQGRHWIGTYAGLSRFDPRTGRFDPQWREAGDPSLERVRRITSDGAGVLWLGTEGGLVRHDPATGATRVFRHDAADPRSVGPGWIVALHVDRHGRLWVGTDATLDRLLPDGEGFEHLGSDVADAPTFIGARVSHITEDRAGRLWVGTSDGLNRIDDPRAATLRYHRYDRTSGLASAVIGAVLEDEDGRLWISSTSGLARLDPATGEVRNFTNRDGLIDGSFYVGSALAARDGALLFGGRAGLNEFHARDIRDNVVPPAVAITDLQLANKPVDATALPDGVELDGPVERARTLRLAHAQAVLTFEFAALHYADPQRNRYAYRLLGFDSAWIEADASRRYATYTNLAPGDYVFEVKAANKDGVWSLVPAHLAITVLPPWWATWWARAAAVALFVLAIWAVFRYRVRGLTRQRARLEREVAIAVTETTHQKEAIEHAHQNLIVLGEIGREITASLEQADVVATLDRRAHALLDATTFAIYVLDEAEGVLESIHDVEEGQPLPPERIALDDPSRSAACCARERRELQFDFAPGDANPSQVPGTLVILSALFAPLIVGQRVLGVMTMQSPRRHAYGERERVIFRSLCAYGAIALHNAATYRRLRETDEKLQRNLRELQIIFDNNVGSIAIIRHGRLERCSRGFLAMYGYDADEVIGMPVDAFSATPEESQELGRATADDLAAGKVVGGEFRYRRKDGSMGWLVYQGRALAPPDLAQGSIWLSQDITEIKEQESALRESNAHIERSLREVEQLNRQVTLLGELTGFLQACPSAAEAFACIGEFGPRLFPGSAGVLLLADEDGRTWLEHGCWGGVTHAGESISTSDCWALRRSRAYRVDAPSEALCCPHVRAHGARDLPYACLPLTAQGKTFGLLHLAHADAIAPGDALERRHGMAVAMADQIALAIANVQLREQLLMQSIRDPLTGLFNRRHLQEALFREIARSRREHAVLALLMVDVDHFKRCNDRYGHPAGDAVLQAVAKVLEAQVRQGELACRYGGEEFAVLLPGCDLDGALRVAERILAGVRGLALTHEGRALEPVTVSIGLALCPRHGSSPQSLVEAADAALYAAKEDGRDRLVVSGVA